MPAPYSPLKVDLYTPARSGNFFSGITRAQEPAYCAEMARLAYCRMEPAFQFDRRQMTDVLQRQGFASQFFESKHTPDGRGTHCVLAVDAASRLAIVAFRGTDASDPSDLYDDADALQTAWAPGGRVHSGFAHALAQVQDELLAALKPLNGYTRLYTGHSLGAALATLLAGIVPPAHLYTIGSPRVGDPAFAATLNGIPTGRCVDCCDVVTRIPPANVPGLGTYQHVGDPIYIFQNRTVAPDPGAAAIEQDQLRASADYLVEFAWRSGTVAVRELADHSPINYVEALK